MQTINIDTGEMQTHYMRSRYNYTTDTRATAVVNDEPTMTQQHMAEETDINTIVKRFGMGQAVPTNLNMPMQGDFEDAPDYKTALNLLIEAEHEFMRLPAEVREEFQNDPGRFIEFFEDPKNLDRARELGLARPLEQPQGPIEVRVVAEPPKDT